MDPRPLTFSSDTSPSGGVALSSAAVTKNTFARALQSQGSSGAVDVDAEESDGSSAAHGGAYDGDGGGSSSDGSEGRALEKGRARGARRVLHSDVSDSGSSVFGGDVNAVTSPASSTSADAGVAGTGPVPVSSSNTFSSVFLQSVQRPPPPPTQIPRGPLHSHGSSHSTGRRSVLPPPLPAPAPAHVSRHVGGESDSEGDADAPPTLSTSVAPASGGAQSRIRREELHVAATSRGAGPRTTAAAASAATGSSASAVSAVSSGSGGGAAAAAAASAADTRSLLGSGKSNRSLMASMTNSKEEEKEAMVAPVVPRRQSMMPVAGHDESLVVTDALQRLLASERNNAVATVSKKKRRVSVRPDLPSTNSPLALVAQSGLGGLKNVVPRRIVAKSDSGDDADDAGAVGVAGDAGGETSTHASSPRGGIVPHTQPLSLLSGGDVFVHAPPRPLHAAAFGSLSSDGTAGACLCCLLSCSRDCVKRCGVLIPSVSLLFADTIPALSQPFSSVHGIDPRIADVRFTDMNVLYIHSAERRGAVVDQSGVQGSVDAGGLDAATFKRGLQVRVVPAAAAAPGAVARFPCRSARLFAYVA